MTVTDPLGHQVSALEVKDADLAPTMVRALARQAAAEREKQDKIIAIVFPIPIEPFDRSWYRRTGWCLSRPSEAAPAASLTTRRGRE
jgi:hypothetical protein